MYADDSFTRSERSFEPHYFDTMGISEVTVPPGTVEVDVMRGFEFGFEHRKVDVSASRTSTLTMHLWPSIPYDPAEWVVATCMST
jgi:hypothetical protein